MTGKGIEPPFASHIDLDVREIAADGAKSVFVDMFDGRQPACRSGRSPRVDQNPLVLVFLQRDVTQMANLTGGAAVLLPAAGPPRLQRPGRGRAVSR